MVNCRSWLSICCCSFISCAWLFVTPWIAARHSSLSFTISQSLLKLMSTELVMPANHLILCCPLFLPLIFPRIRVFSNELALHIRWPNYWSFSFSIRPSNVYSGLISFRIDWLDLLVAQRPLMDLFQHHNLKASILWHSAFFTVQLSHPYMTTMYGKTIALTGQIFVGKVMSWLFNMLSWFIIVLTVTLTLKYSGWQDFSSVQFSCSVLSNSLQSHGL